MFFKNKDNMEIFYKDSGNIDDKPIVFLHAWGSNHTDFDYTFENLEGYRRVVYDHRGFGNSEKPEKKISLKHLANDLYDLIGYLELKNVILVGYSMGASVLYKYIELFGTNNISAVVICDMTPKMTCDNGWKYGILDGKYSKDDVLETMALHFDDLTEAYMQLYKAIDPSLNEKNDRALKRMIEIDLSKNSYYSITAMWFSLCYEDFRKSIKKIDIPTGLFFAHPGSLINPETVEYLESHIKDTYTHIFEESTHSFVNCKPKKFMNELKIFLERIN